MLSDLRTINEIRMSFRPLFLLSSVSHVLHLSLDLHHMIFHIRAGLVGFSWGQKLEANISKVKIGLDLGEILDFGQ